MIEEEHHEGLVGPIESGKTSSMPITPGDGEEAISDHYFVECDHLDVQPKNIILPKFIFNPAMGYKEKGLLLLTFDGDHSTGIYAKVLKAANKGFKNFKIMFLNEDEDNVISVWEFEQARLHAVDFGNVAKARSTSPEFAVEIDYSHLSIDGESI